MTARSEHELDTVSRAFGSALPGGWLSSWLSAVGAGLRVDRDELLPNASPEGGPLLSALLDRLNR